MPKWRPHTPPILGQQLARALDRIEELERAAASKAGGAAGYGGGGGGPPTGERIQAGSVVTDGNGHATITFPVAFSAAPIVVLTVLNTGALMIIAELESISPTQAVISTARIDQQGTGTVTGTAPDHYHNISRDGNTHYDTTEYGGSHNHAVLDVYPHAHNKVLQGGIAVYWIAMPAT